MGGVWQGPFESLYLSLFFAAYDARQYIAERSFQFTNTHKRRRERDEEEESRQTDKQAQTDTPKNRGAEEGERGDGFQPFEGLSP